MEERRGALRKVAFVPQKLGHSV